MTGTFRSAGYVAGDVAGYVAGDVAGYVALTFDDGPTAGTGALLDVLRANGLRATMFNIGRRVSRHPELALAQRAAGMWVANHSWSHPHLPRLGRARIHAELARTQDAIHAATGSTPRLFRPPYGDTDAIVGAVAAGLALTEVLWAIDARDWAGAGPAQIVAAAGRLGDGQVILMHDGIPATVDAIPRIAAGLASRGLCAGAISPTTGRAVAPTPPP